MLRIYIHKVTWCLTLFNSRLPLLWHLDFEELIGDLIGFTNYIVKLRSRSRSQVRSRSGDRSGP